MKIKNVFIFIFDGKIKLKKNQINKKAQQKENKN